MQSMCISVPLLIVLLTGASTTKLTDVTRTLTGTPPALKTRWHLPKRQLQNEWQNGIVTVYHRRFEGRLTANGTRFSHRNMTVAYCSGRLGEKYQLKYGKYAVIVTNTDRGNLKSNQFDTTQAVARRLGLYRLTSRGVTDRRIMFRRIGK